MSLTRPDGITINFDYDTTGRLFEIELPGGSTLNYVYDQNTGTLNNIITTDNGTLSFTYDGSLPTKTAWNGPIQGNVGVSYNNDLLVTAQNINGANAVNLEYNNDNQLTSIGDLSLNYDTTTGMFNGSSIGNITASVIARNEFGEIGDYRVRYNGSDIFGTQYTYDKLGRITDKTETTNGQTHTYHYDYDLIGQLTDVWKDGALSSHYDYDSNGNRVGGTYDAQDRMLSYGSNTYQYTANGELKQKVTPDGTTNYSYDPLGNLTSVTLPDGTKIDYVIDGANRRVGKKVNGVLAQGFLYQDALKPVAELDGNGNVVSRFVYGTSSIVPDYMIKNGITYRIVSDHLGSVRMVVDVNTGQVVQEISYDEWGNITQDTNPNFQSFAFAGGLYDKDTKLIRFGARDYDAETGRWTRKDPIGFKGGDTDLYAYCNNDPVNYLDWDGLSKCDQLRWEIDDLVDELADRWDAMNRDPNNLYRNRKTGTNSWEGHQQKYRDVQQELKDKIDEYKNGGCEKETGKLPQEVEDLVNTPAPEKPRRYRQGEMAIKIGGSAVVGYGLYRGIRLLPSLLPPLWWTIPVNLATP